MYSKSRKIFLTKVILVVLCFQLLQLDITFWVLKTQKVSAESGIITPELEALAENNPELTQTYTEEKRWKLEDLQERIDWEIETTWYGKARSDEDRKKKEQLDILENIEDDGFNDLWDEDKYEIDGLLELEEIVVLMEENGEIKEVNPVLVQSTETGGLVTTDTEYEALIPEKGSDGISLGIRSEKLEIQNDHGDIVQENSNDSEQISVKFTQIGANDVEVKTEDNKALYEEIYPDVDLLLTTLPEGVKEDLILKRPNSPENIAQESSNDNDKAQVGDVESVKEPFTGSGWQLNQQDWKIVSGFIEEGQWVFNYEVDLEGVTVEESEKGLKFFDEDRNEVMFTPAPVMYDRYGKESGEAYFEIVTEEEMKHWIINDKLEIIDEQEEETGTGVVTTETGVIVLEEEVTGTGSQIPLEGDIEGVEHWEEEDVEDTDFEGELDPLIPLHSAQDDDNEIDGNDLNSYEDFVEAVEKAEEIEDQEKQINDDDTYVEENEEKTFKGVGGGWSGGGGSSITNDELEIIDDQEDATQSGSELTGSGSEVVGTGSVSLEGDTEGVDYDDNQAIDEENEDNNNSTENETDSGSIVNDVSWTGETAFDESSEQDTDTGSVITEKDNETTDNELPITDSSEIDGNELEDYEDFVEAVEKAEEIEEVESAVNHEPWATSSESQGGVEDSEEQNIDEYIENDEESVPEEPMIEEIPEPIPESEPVSEPVIDEAPAVEPASDETAFWQKLFGIPLAVAESGDDLITNDEWQATSHEPWAMSLEIPSRGQGGVEDDEGQSEDEKQEKTDTEDNGELWIVNGEWEKQETQSGSNIPLEGDAGGVDSDENQGIDDVNEEVENEENNISQKSNEVVYSGTGTTASGSLSIYIEESETSSWEIVIEEEESNSQATNYELPTTNSKIYIRLVADTSGLIYPIDLDPSIFVNLYDKGNRTFAPNFEQGNQHGEYSQTNNPGRINRGTESTQTGGTLTAINSSSVTVIDALGDQSQGNNVTNSQDWSAVNNSLYTSKVGTKIEFTTGASTEIWAGLTYSPAGGIVKATVYDSAGNIEVVNEIDLYADTKTTEQKTLIATGLKNSTHTVELELTGKRNIKQSDPTYSTLEGDTYVEDVFSTYLYTGNGTSQTIENGIDLDGNGGMVWVKSRTNVSTSYHALYDTERGTGKLLYSNGTNAEGTNVNSLTGFNSNWFTVGSSDQSNSSSDDFASWTFREAPGFFDVVTYTGDGQSGREIAHDLGVKPGMIIVKRTDSGSNWFTYHWSLGATKSLILNLTNAEGTSSSYWNDTEPTSSNFTIGTANNDNSASFVAYLFAHDPSADGKVQCGNYTTDAGEFAEIDLGWEPQFLLSKWSGGTTDWRIVDTMRGTTVGGEDYYLEPNTNDTESSATNVFTVTQTWFTQDNFGANRTYIYCAIRAPQKEPVNSSEVFATNDFPASAWANQTLIDTGFVTDLSIIKTNRLASSNYLTSRITGGRSLLSESTIAEVWTTTEFDHMNWFVQSITNDDNAFSWSFKRAPGFFDVVAYEGDGLAGRTVEHNLGVEPEMIWVKTRESVRDWDVYSSAIGSNWRLQLNQNYANDGNTSSWGDTFTSTQFTVDGNYTTNELNKGMIAYLFATLPDVSKVGSYTGTAADLDIDAGFTQGTKFVLIKRTDATGDWYFWDTERGIVSGNDPYLLLNSTAAEVTTTDYIDPYTSGFRITSSAPAALNASGGEYIYLAIAGDNGETQPSGGSSTQVPDNARLSVDYIETYSVGDELQTTSYTGTADNGTTTGLTDAALTQADDYYNGYALTFTSGLNIWETVYVTDFDAASDTLSFSPAVDYAINTESYQLTNDWIFINSRATRGVRTSPLVGETERGIAAKFAIEGNLPTNNEGKSEKGTFSIWIKPDFSYDADANQHYVFDSGLQRLYYDGSDNQWHFEIYNGTNWTTVSVSSAAQTFNAQDSIHLAATWNADSGLKLLVNNTKSTASVTWTAQPLSANTSTGTLVIGSNAASNSKFDGVLAEPQIFDYVLTDSEIKEIYNSETPSVGQAHTQRIEVETNSQLTANGSQLLFNSPMVQTPNDRIGTLAGAAKLGSTQVGTVATGSTLIHHGDSLGQAGGVLNTDGLVGYWKMNGDFTDISWNGNDGTGNGGVGFDENGKFDEAGSFDGTDDYVNISNPNIETGDFAISGWFKTTAVGNSFITWFGKSGDIYPLINLQFNSDGDGTGYRFIMRGTTAEKIDAKYDGVSNDGSWHHLVGVKQGDTGYLYLDGVLKASDTTLITGDLDYDTFRIGGLLQGVTDMSSNGTIDEVAIFNRALSTTEISNIYNAQKGSYLTYETPEATTEIIAGLNTGPNNGIAKVTIDGWTAKEIVTEIDTYNSTEETDQRFLVATWLDSDIHTVKIEATGLKNLSSSGDAVLPKFVETASQSSVASSQMTVNGRLVDDVIVQDYTALPNAVQFPDKGNISENEHEGTIEMWVETEWAGNDGLWHYILDTRDGSGYNGLYLDKNNSNNIRLMYANATENLLVFSPSVASAWTANVPHHLMLKWWEVDNLTMGFALYFDGKKLTENKSFSVSPSNHTQISLGTNYQALWTDYELYDFDGSIYDFSIYSQAFDDGGALVGENAGTWSSVFNAYKSIANDQLRITNVEIDSSLTVNMRDGSNTNFYLENGGLLNSSGSTATNSDLKAYVNGIETTVSSTKAGTYARVNDTSWISEIEESITVDSIINESEIPSSGFLYLGNPSGHLKREKVYYSSYSGGTFSGLKRGICVQNNHYCSTPTKWDNNTIVEIVGSVTLASAPVEDTDLWIEYSYSGDAVDRSRSSTNYQLPTINFLDNTEGLTTAWTGVDANTSLLIHSDTTDGVTTFTDSSLSLQNIATAGNVHHETDQSKFGDTSVYFDGTGDYLIIDDSEKNQISTGTIDFWVYTSAWNANDMLISKYDSAWGGYLQYYSGELIYRADWNSVSVSFGSPSVDNWHHIALVSTGSEHIGFVDGVEVDRVTSSVDLLGNGDLYIGGNDPSQGAMEFTGYIDEFRISKDVIRWTDDFTPPTHVYPLAPKQTATTQIGQTALIKLRWTEISTVLNEKIGSGSTALFVIDEGTVSEKTVIVDSSKSNNIAKVKSLATNLLDDLHTIRLVNLENKTLALDAMQFNGHAPILKKAASKEVLYQTPVADLNPLTMGEGKVNDVFYWKAASHELWAANERRTNLVSDLNTSQTEMVVDSVEHLPDSGIVQINDEQIKYGAKASDWITSKLLNLQRGYNATTASSHLMSASEEIVSGLSNVNDIFLYDTTNDTVENSWRFDTSKSWYSESSSATRCPNGYQDSGSQKCTRAFPEVAVLVAVANQIDVYDAESKELWMSIGPYSLGGAGSPNIFAFNGKIYIGKTTTSALRFVNFTDDSISWMSAGSHEQKPGNISARNSDTGAWTNLSSMRIVNANVNDVHASVIDDKTYVAVATDGGVSVINETDGTVVDVALDAHSGSDFNLEYLHLTSSGDLYISANNTTNSLYHLNAYYDIQDITSDEPSEAAYRDSYYRTNTPALLTSSSTSINSLNVTESTSLFGGNTIYVGTDVGVTVIQEKQGDESNGSVKYITSDYITEEMVGDIRGMWTFDGSTPLTDNSVKTNDLTNNNSVTFATDGVRNKAASFDGTNYLSTSDVSDFSSMETGTISGWFKADSESRVIFNLSNASTTTDFVNIAVGGWTGSYNDESFAWMIRKDNTYPLIAFVRKGHDYYVDSQWHHYSVVMGSNYNEIYIDGEKQNVTYNIGNANIGGSFLNITNPNTLMIGGRELNNTPTELFDGEIDEISITAETLDAATNRRMYETGKAALESSHEQKLNGNSDYVKSISVNRNSLYIASGSGTDAGIISKINLNSDSRVKTIDTTSSFGGSSIGTLDTISAVSVWDAGVYFADGDELYTDFAEVQTVANYATDNQGDWTQNGTASWYQEVWALPEELKILAMDTGLALLDSNDNSMWMHFGKDTNTLFTANTGNYPSSVVAWDGIVWTGFSGTGSLGLLKIDYINDIVEKFDSTQHSTGSGYSIAQRNTNSPSWNTGSGESIIGNSILDIDLIPGYLAIATENGVSVLNTLNNTTAASTETSSTSYVKFDGTDTLYYSQGSNLYKETAFTSDFTADQNVDLSSNINAITMSSEYIYAATDNGVKKVDKANLTGWAVLTIDSSNTDSTINKATAVDYSGGKLIITFSDGTEGNGKVIVWDIVNDSQNTSYDIDEGISTDVLHSAAVTAGGDIVIGTEEGLSILEAPENYNTLEIASGNNQLGEMLSPLTQSLRVRVSDGFGYYAGSGDVVVDFAITSQPTWIGTGAVLSASSVATDASGHAEVNFTLGDRAGEYQITANFSGATASQVFTVTEKEKFTLKISGDKEHVFELDPNGQTYYEKTNTVTLTHNAESFDFKSIVDYFPTDGVNTINDWDGTRGFAWMDGATPTAFGTGATVYSSSGPEVNGIHDITFRIQVDYYSPVSQGFDGQVSWDVENLSF